MIPNEEWYRMQSPSWSPNRLTEAVPDYYLASREMVLIDSECQTLENLWMVRLILPFDLHL